MNGERLLVWCQFGNIISVPHSCTHSDMIGFRRENFTWKTHINNRDRNKCGKSYYWAFTSHLIVTYFNSWSQLNRLTAQQSRVKRQWRLIWKAIFCLCTASFIVTVYMVYVNHVGFGFVEMTISTNPKPTKYIVTCTRIRAQFEVVWNRSSEDAN